MSTLTPTPPTPTPTPPPPPPAPPARGPALGRLAFGGLLVLLGGAWLADRAGIDVSWRPLLSLALIGVGLTLLATARRGTAAGLIPVGVILTVLLALTPVTMQPWPAGSVGDRDFRPTDMTELEASYDLGAGDLLVDLSRLDLPPGETRVQASVGMGQVTVRVPEDVRVELTASSGMGEVVVLGRQQGGIGTEITEIIEGSEGTRLVLEVSSGMGKVEVLR